MKHSTKPPTRAERARFEALHEIGCICCRKRGFRSWPVEIHHLLSGNRRRGHLYTIPLSPWSHRGVLSCGWTRSMMTDVFGPSLAHGSKPFHAAFGSDDSLLAEVNALIEQRRAA